MLKMNYKFINIILNWDRVVLDLALLSLFSSEDAKSRKQLERQQIKYNFF